MEDKKLNIVCIGGGHCNCQVLKLLKQQLPDNAKLTLVTEAPMSYYSGMLPGAASRLYKDEDIQVQLEPLAKWCRADYVEKRVKQILGKENKLLFEDNSTLDYDVLAVNVGSRTRGAEETKGVWEYSLTTRPINELLGKIQRKENDLVEKKIVPRVVVCGAGAAGLELSFGFQKRWTDVFGDGVKVTLIASESDVLFFENQAVRDESRRKLQEKGIELIVNGYVAEITADAVVLRDGRSIPCDVPIWATGAQPQHVTDASDLDILKGYFKVNDYMQSTSHPNIFAGGDCVCMETYAEKNFPPKAGVYAVRAGPFIAKNVVHYLKGEPLEKYVPQSGFLSLLMTGDGKAIGSKFGISFVGKWVWKMKDYIDVGFMKLFDPKYLFKDPETMNEPLENNELFEDEKTQERTVTDQIRAQVNEYDALTSAKKLLASEEDEEFFEQLYIIGRMGLEEEYCKEVVANFNRLKFQDK